MKLPEAFAAQSAKSQLFKFLIVGLIILVAVFFDQWTKNWAQNNLASNRYAEHYVTATVDNAKDTPTLADFVAKKYPNNSEIENKRIMAYASTDGKHLNPQDELNDGQIIHMRNVGITVIDGYYDYQYARNPGAAFSFLADKSPEFRSIFFGITGILAIILILFFIGASSWKNQKPLIISLACVLGGALGNVIDRARLSYVIDFVSWHVGDHYWPTFNIADVFVTCGVAFLILDMIVNHKKYEDKAVEDKSDSKDNAPKSSDSKEDAPKSSDSKEDAPKSSDSKEDAPKSSDSKEDEKSEVKSKEEKDEKTSVLA